MKKFIIITAMFVFTISMSAQTDNSRSRTPGSGTAVERKANDPKKNYETSRERSNSSAVKTRSTGTNNSRQAVRTRPTGPEKASSLNKNRSAASNERQDRNTNTEVRRSRTTTTTKSVTRSTQPRESMSNTGNGNRRTATSTRGSYENRSGNQAGYRYEKHYDPKDGKSYEARRRVYTTPAPHRIVRPAPKIHYIPRSIEYKRVYYPYIAPVHISLYWTRNMHREYIRLYPNYDLWYYPYGYRINTISAYDAGAYVGEVARIYGKVYESWYAGDRDEYFLYFGGPYPYHDFSVVLEGRDARKFSRRPERFFENRNISVTGLVSLWEGKPEIVVKKRQQIDLY